MKIHVDSARSVRSFLSWIRIVLVIGLALSLTPAKAAPALTLNVNAGTGSVNPGDPCPSPRNGAIYKMIQKAVNCAQAGDTISVAAGNYLENVSVPKTLILLGANAGVDARGSRFPETVVNGGGVSAAFAISAGNVTIDGFLVRGGQNGLGAGIWMGEVSGIQILNNVITDNAIGLFPHTCPCLVQHNLFDGNNRTGAAGGTGLYTETTHSLVIEENEFRNHTVNTTVNFASASVPSHFNPVFTGNTIHNNRLGTYIIGVSAGTFQGNHYAGQTFAGMLFDGGNSNINVSGNTFTNNVNGIRMTDNYGANTNIQVRINRFVANAPAIRVASGNLNAENNWWGCNLGPGAIGAGCSTRANGVVGGVDANPWLVLRLSSAPASVPAGGNTTALSAALVYNSAGGDTSGLGYLPDGLIIAFSGTLGSIVPMYSAMVSGAAASTFTSGPATGTASITARLDNQTVTSPLPVIAPSVDLALGKTDGGISARPGGAIAYTLAYTNTGNSIASGVSIVETVPEHTTYNAAASLPAVWSCADGSPAGTVCGIALANLPGAGGTGSLLFAVTVIAPLPPGSTNLILTNSARIEDDGSHGADPPRNNIALDQTPVISFAMYLPLNFVR